MNKRMTCFKILTVENICLIIRAFDQKLPLIFISNKIVFISKEFPQIYPSTSHPKLQSTSGLTPAAAAASGAKLEKWKIYPVQPPLWFGFWVLRKKPQSHTHTHTMQESRKSPGESRLPKMAIKITFMGLWPLDYRCNSILRSDMWWPHRPQLSGLPGLKTLRWKCVCVCASIRPDVRLGSAFWTGWSTRLL